MNGKVFPLAVWVMWLALPLTALDYWRSWDQLPMRMAVHFDINWQPNGWTSRGGSLGLALGTTAFLVVVFTIAGYAMRRAAVPKASAWAIIAVAYAVLGFVLYINHWVVARNLTAQRPVALVDVGHEVRGVTDLMVRAVG
jgi:hypothetical protein